MKIIEAMKEMPLILKKMGANNNKIGGYASTLSTVKDLPFGSIEEQKKEVAGLVQSNQDLYTRYLMLQRSLAYTNTQVEVEVKGEKRSIAEWLHIRNASRLGNNSLHEYMLGTYRSLNTQIARAMLTDFKGDLAENSLQIVRCYDEKMANENVERLSDIYDAIDAKLEVVNATTDLIEI